MINKIFDLSASIRYVAIYHGQELQSKSKANTAGASDSETDKYEELLVNPTLLKLASQRGNIDCGGLQHRLSTLAGFEAGRSAAILPSYIPGWITTTRQ
jgi:hypothetical protein